MISLPNIFPLLNLLKRQDLLLTKQEVDRMSESCFITAKLPVILRNI